MTYQEHIVFGIDLGTTYSCIAYVDQSGQPVIIPDEDTNHTVPSVVLFEGDKRVVGREAKNSALLSPEHVIQMIKRQMGNRLYRFRWQEEDYTPEEISSYILRKLALQAQRKLGIEVRDVVITCPAYFGIAQREATALAGKLAGLNVREIINEPSAAAIMYGAHKEKEREQTVLIFDLGGGTFDVTVIKIMPGAITVVATGGDHHLGGYEWDEALVGYLAEEWKKEAHSLDDPLDSEVTAQEMFNKAEEAKRDLTKLATKKVFFSHDGYRVTTTLTRQKFNELTEALLDSTMRFTEMTLQEARKRGVEIDRILLVGGATKMPQIAEALEKRYHIKPELYEPDEAVAKGAAIYGQKLALDEVIQLSAAEETGIAAYDGMDISDIPTGTRNMLYKNASTRTGIEQQLLQRFHGLQIKNVASHSFGIIALNNAGQQVIDNLVFANQGLPVRVSRDDYRRHGKVKKIAIKIMENNYIDARIDDSERISQSAEIGSFYLPMPDSLPENAPLNITFEMNKQGRLHVTVRELIKGNQIDEEIETTVTLSEKELNTIQQRLPRLEIL